MWIEINYERFSSRWLQIWDQNFKIQIPDEIRQISSNFDQNELWGVFWVANYEFEILLEEFKLAEPIWRTQVVRNLQFELKRLLRSFFEKYITQVKHNTLDI